MHIFVIVELGVAERIVELYGTACLFDGSGGALHALVFSVEFVDQIQSLCLVHKLRCYYCCINS